MEAQNSTLSLHDAPTYGLPAPDGDAERKTSLLLVYLTDLDEAAEEKFIRFLQPSLQGDDRTLHTWKPSAAVLRYIAYPGPHKDSQANLYAVSTLAYRAGWTSLLVADSLTKRQLDGTAGFGESRLPTLVMISIKPRREPYIHTNDQVRVVAKRTVGWEGENSKLHQMLETTIDPEEVVRPEEMYRNGMVLHDPDRGPFAPDTASLLARESRSNAIHGALSKLPNELVDDILARAGGDDASQTIELPSWIQNDDKHLNIFLLFSTTSEELDSMQSAIQKTVQFLHKEGAGKDGEEQQVKLISWEHCRVESRRQLRNLWDEYQLLLPHYLFARAVYFLLEPVMDTEDIQLGTCNYVMEFPMNISWKPLDEVVKTQNVWGLQGDKRPDADPYSMVRLDHVSNEVMLSPDQPFYSNPTIWWPGRGRLDWVVVFYLTNKLTGEQDKALRASIQEIDESDSDEDKVCCFIPWRSGHEDEPDGTVEDMWEMFFHSLKGSFGIMGESSVPIFCIDQQSGIDNKLTVLFEQSFLPRESDKIAAEELLKDVDVPATRGMLYGRIRASSAHNVHANLSIGNLNLEEILEYQEGDGEPMHVFPRPGWPGHGVLVDSDSDQGDE